MRTIVMLLLATLSFECCAQLVLTQEQQKAVDKATAPEAADLKALYPNATSANGTHHAFFIQNKDDVVGELVNHEVAINALNVDGSAKVSSLTALFGAQEKKIVLQRDHISYKFGADKKKYGILIRVEVAIATKEAGFDFGSIFAIGAVAKKSMADSQLRVKIYGLSGPPITALLPSPSEVSDASVQQAMEAVALIKSKIHDSKVVVIPQELK